MPTEKELVFLGRSNTNDFILKEDGVAVDLGGLTKIDLLFDDTTLVTNTTAAEYPIKWDENETGEQGKIMCQLGDKNIATGARTAKLITYDASNPDGVVWSGQNGIPFFVVAADA